MRTDTRTGKRRRPSRQSLQRDLRALADLDARDYAFAKRLDSLLEQAYMRTPPNMSGSTIPVTSLALLDDQPAPQVKRPAQWARRIRVYLAALVVLAVAASGSLAYVDLWNPSPASAAQAILHRAAAAASHLPPHHAVHLVYRLTNVLAGSGRVSGKLVIWIQADAHGVPALVAETQTMAASTGTTPMVDRRVLHGRAGQEYSSGDNTVRMVAVGADGPELFISGVRYFSAFAQGPDQRVRLLPSRMLDGARVAAVQVDPLYAPGYTVYFDTRSYVLRGMDIAGGRGGRGRLVSVATMPASAVPPGTFMLNAPPTARRSSNTVYVGDMPSLDHPALALVSICNTPPHVLSAAMAAGTRSPLAICQATDPGMTKATLIADLAAEERARLGLVEGIAVGKITPAQASRQLTALQTKLATWVERPLTD
jgi:hypothetical protein